MNVKLKYLKKWLKSRKQVALNYDKKIKNSVIKPTTSPNNTHAYHLYVIRVKNRSKVIKELKKIRLIVEFIIQSPFTNKKYTKKLIKILNLLILIKLSMK